MRAYPFSVLAVDPGTSTGIVLARILWETDVKVAVNLFRHATFPHPLDVPALLSTWAGEEIWAVVMEGLPAYPHQAGADAWYHIRDGLVGQGFWQKQAHRVMWDEKSISQVSPGHWKPFVRREHPSPTVNLKGATKHVKEAVGILHYWIRTNTYKEVQYV